MTRRDVLVIAKGYPPAVGGIETYSERVARAYRRHARRVIVITQCPGIAGTSRRQGVIVVNVGAGPQASVFFRFLGVLLRLRRADAGLARFALIHATTWRVGIPAALITRRPPLTVTVHGREVRIVPWLLRPAMTWVLRRADLIVGVSSVALKAARCDGPGTVVAFNGLSYPRDAAAVDTPGRRGAGGELRILTLCRLVERKNVQGALRAIGILKRRGMDGFRYLVAGTGPMREKLNRIVEEERMEDNVEFLGHVPEEAIVSLYRQTDIFLHPQIAADNDRDIEGFGLTIADAMSFGAAVLAGSAGGPSDFIQPGVTGMLVDGLDHDAVADALERLVVDDSFRNEIGRNGRSWALDHLSWDNHVRTILDHQPTGRAADHDLTT